MRCSTPCQRSSGHTALPSNGHPWRHSSPVRRAAGSARPAPPGAPAAPPAARPPVPRTAAPALPAVQGGLGRRGEQASGLLTRLHTLNCCMALALSISAPSMSSAFVLFPLNPNCPPGQRPPPAAGAAAPPPPAHGALGVPSAWRSMHHSPPVTRAAAGLAKDG